MNYSRFFAFLLTASLLMSCNDDGDSDNDGNSNPNLTSQLNANITGEPWVITEFFDDGDDETDDFDGFIFEFNPDSTLTAIKVSDSTTTVGAWFTFFDDGQTELWIEFNDMSDSRFEELSEDWYVISQSDDLIRLREDDDPDDDEDRLRFER